MPVLNFTRDYVSVFETLVEYALFPPAAQYVTFPTSIFASGQRMKGRRTFEMQGSHGAMPFILWFLNDPPDIGDESVGGERITGTVTIMVAHQHPDLKVADQAVKRDIGLVKECLYGQLRTYEFFYTNTSVVPAAFGTVHTIEGVEFLPVETRPYPELGPGVVAGGCAVVIPLLVDATN